MRSSVEWKWLIALWLVASCGCSRTPKVPDLPRYPVEGIIYLRGAPVKSAQITFFVTTADPSEFTARAECDAKGKYVLKTKETDGAVAGEFDVAVSGGKPAVPEKFGNFKNSGIHVTVKADGKNVFDIYLTDKSAAIKSR